MVVDMTQDGGSLISMIFTGVNVQTGLIWPQGATDPPVEIIISAMSHLPHITSAAL